MKNELRNEQQTLNCHISGFHQYCFQKPAHLGFVSRNLCRMLERTEAELLSENQDRYLPLVHEADRQMYAAFLEKLSRDPQTLTCRYRLVKQDGSILYVSDTMTSYYQDGLLLGDSVLTDITELKQENRNLQFLDETIPCGFLRYTCEKTPRITYLNDRMLQILGFPAEGTEDWELYAQNIYLMIPMEERRRFSRYLERVSRTSTPLAGEMTVLRCDGTRAHLFGWVTKCISEDGTEEFQSACMDITERHQIQKEQETRRYLRALTGVYDKIFEYDLSARTVTCLWGQDSPTFRWLENIPMQMEEATEKWILGSASPEDREKLRSFFGAFYQGRFTAADTPPVIRYRARSSDGLWTVYTGLFVKLDAAVSLFCCRRLPDGSETDQLRSENTALKDINENMQRIVRHFTEGIAAFEIFGDVVTPLYASDNVCEFFGYSREDWMSVMQKRTPIREFVSRSKAAYGEFVELLAKGEAEFTYYDLKTDRQRRIKAVCSQKNAESDIARYVMLYNIDPEEQTRKAPCPVRIRTFGYFDVFVDGRPIAFRNEKSKELFALLVDRRGGFVSSEEAISYLWEDEPVNAVTLSRYRKVALRLKNILEEYGIPDIVESVSGKRRIVMEKVQCDLYDYLSGEEAFAQLFKGSYLTNYSWAETTLAELTGDHLYGTGG